MDWRTSDLFNDILKEALKEEFQLDSVGNVLSLLNPLGRPLPAWFPQEFKIVLD